MTPRTAAAMGWLALLGVAATFVGGHDLIAATDFATRMWGGFVFGAGAVLIAGANGLRDDGPTGRALALVAALLGILCGAMMLIAQVMGDALDLRLAAWLAIAAASAGAARQIRTATPEDERKTTVWARLPMLKSVVSVGVIASLGQFWYTTVYVPTTAPANLTVEPALAQTVRGDHVVLRGSVTIRNTSGTRVDVLASYFDIGARAAHSISDNTAYPADLGTALDPDAPPAKRYMQSDPSQSVMHGPLVEQGTYLDPGETVTRSFVAWVPVARFDVAEMSAWMAIARARGLDLETESASAIQERDLTIVVTRIPSSGWLRSLTRGDRYVRVEYDNQALDDPTLDDPARTQPPNVSFSPTLHRADRGFDARMWRLYGASEVLGHTEIPL